MKTSKNSQSKKNKSFIYSDYKLVRDLLSKDQYDGLYKLLNTRYKVKSFSDLSDVVVNKKPPFTVYKKSWIRHLWDKYFSPFLKKFNKNEYNKSI